MRFRQRAVVAIKQLSSHGVRPACCLVVDNSNSAANLLAMHVELINTGTELMLGRVLNTHQQWLGRQLADAGYLVARQVAVPDTGTAIQETVKEALARADLIITTGGLGPTADDLTRELIADLLGAKLSQDQTILDHIRSFFEARKRPMPERTRLQAMIPEGALVLPNPNGTAPGLAMKVSPNRYRPGQPSSWIVMLPGPPRELRPMFQASVLPLLRDVLPLSSHFVCRTFRSTGIGESVVEELLAEPLAPSVAAGLDLGYCARTGQVDVRLAARGPNAEGLIEAAARIVYEKLGTAIYGEEDAELENVIIQMLTERRLTLATAESCTGGHIAHKLTNVPGASAVFLGGVVAYSNELKENFLVAKPEDIRLQGAVSEVVAGQMAVGVRQRTGADVAVSVTGIAGPSGASADKPVGTVFIGLATRGGTAVVRQFNPYDRETFKQVTTSQALDFVRKALLQEARR